MASAVLFVFYKPDINYESWKYKTFSDNWWCVGGGITKVLEYPRESQFSGNLTSRDQMRDLLIEKFEQLKEKGIIRKYKIRNSYLP